MSFNNFWRSDPKYDNQWLFSYLSGFERIWWALMPGTVIKVKWPRGIAKANPVTGSWDLIATMDPNDHYGPWLDAHVGKRGWNWNWKPIIVNGSLNTAEILIKIRKPKDKLASFFLLSIDSEAK